MFFVFLSLFLVSSINGTRLLLSKPSFGASCNAVRCPASNPKCIETANGVKCVGNLGNKKDVSLTNPCASMLCIKGTICKDLGNGQGRCICAEANKNGKGFAKGKCKKGKPSKCNAPDPCFCPLFFDPVCCDGITYGNNCQAGCECATNCVKGICNSCTPSNEVCPAISDPVCCDGVEYGNKCLADRACADNCIKGSCDKCDPNDLCICTLEYNPICCNGKTYSNKCGAECNCQDLNECSLGECKQEPKPVFCGGIAGIKCPDRYECFDDPRDNCDPDCNGNDCGGFCVKVWDDGNGNKANCGTIAGLQCPDGFQCYDVKGDGCTVCPQCKDQCNSADCIGICADLLLQ